MAPPTFPPSRTYKKSTGNWKGQKGRLRYIKYLYLVMQSLFYKYYRLHLPRRVIVNNLYFWFLLFPQFPSNKKIAKLCAGASRRDDGWRTMTTEWLLMKTMTGDLFGKNILVNFIVNKWFHNILFIILPVASASFLKVLKTIGKENINIFLSQ